MQEAEHADRRTDFRDRSRRLSLFGTLAVLAGGACLGLAVLHVFVLLFAGRIASLQAMPVDPRTYLTGALVYALLGAAFVGAGVGSVRKRRWVRPLMLILAWSWLLGGVMTLLLVPGAVDAAVSTALGDAQSMPTAVLLGLKSALIAGGTLLGVVLPGLFIWVYRDADLLRTCEAADPNLSWTDRCPVPVLGLSVGLGAAAVLVLPLMLRPVVPWFGTLVTGAPGVALMLAGAAVFGWLARSTFRMQPAGWWGAMVVLVLLGVSTWWTFLRVAPAELYRAMGYAEEQVAMLSGVTSGTITAWASFGFTLLTVGYLVSIRRHFRRGAAR